MTITYHGHSACRIRSSKASVVFDPYDTSVGFQLPNMSADIVTVSHDHSDHNNWGAVKPSSRRKKPFIINQPGEYEVGGVSVFGTQVFHDAVQGSERGTNIVYTVLLDDMKVCHLGDLGHELSSQQLDAIGVIDVLFIPVGGVYTITASQAVKVTRALDPSIVIPIHYRTVEHGEQFSELDDISVFLKEYGVEVSSLPKLEITRKDLPEETEVVALSKT